MIVDGVSPSDVNNGSDVEPEDEEPEVEADDDDDEDEEEDEEEDEPDAPAAALRGPPIGFLKFAFPFFEGVDGCCSDFMNSCNSCCVFVERATSF